MTEQRGGLNQLFAACWRDDALKQRFMSDPKAVLAEHGLPVPESVNVTVLENTNNRINITIPAPPSSHTELSDADLAAASGGGPNDICGIFKACSFYSNNPH